MGMSKQDKKILEEIEYLQDRYFTYDDPVPFCGLEIHPVSIRNYNEFLVSNACFLLNKNDDPDGIKLTHLDYLLKKLQDKEQGQMWSYRFSRLLELIFQFKNGLKCEQCGEFLTFEQFSARYLEIQKTGNLQDLLKCSCGGQFKELIRIKKDDKGKSVLVVNGKDITTKDFMRLRKIVLYQNLPDFKDDSWVHKDIRDDQKAKQELLSKNGGVASLEKKMVCVAAMSSYKLPDIYNMTMRKFIMLLNTIDDAITYTTTRIGAMSGFVKMKNPIEHWIYKKDKGMYGEAVDAQAFKNTITNM